MASMTVQIGVGLWLQRVKKKVCVRWYEQVERFSGAWLAGFGAGDKKLDEVTVADVERYEMSRDDGQRSGSAMNQERSYLRNFFKWAKTMGYMAIDPTTNWKSRSSVVRREYAPPTLEEEVALMRHAAPWLGRYIQFSIYTGLRQGTVRKLDWDMVKCGPIELVPGMLLETLASPEVLAKFGVIQIPAMRNGEWIVKTKGGLRFPLVPKIVAALGPVGTGLIFKDLPETANLWMYFKRLVRKAGVREHMSPHDLRRAWVERLSNVGTPLQTIISLGGWRKAGTLLQHYCTPVSLERAAEVLSRI